MKTLNPYSRAYDAPKQGYQFWGINLSNIPTSTTETQISNAFKKYGAIFSIKSLSNSSMNIIFKSPKKPTSINDITNEQKKFKVTPLGSTQLPLKHRDIKQHPVAKLSLLKSSLKFNTKTSKLSSSAAPFTSPPRIVHTTTATKPRVETDTTANTTEAVFFEAVCKSISHGTTEEQVLDFIAQNIYANIKQEVVKDDMMMLPGESMAVFELTNAKAIHALTHYQGRLSFNGHTFTLQRKSDNAETVAVPNKGLSLKIDDEEDCDAERTINSNGVNVVNDKNGVDYLMGVGFDYGLKAEGGDDDSKKSSDATPKKNFYFKLPPDAQKIIAKQAQTLDIPTQAFLLMLGVYTTDGPVPVKNYMRWKQDGYVGQYVNPNKAKKMGNASNNSSKTAVKNTNVGEVSKRSGSTVGRTGSNAAATALFDGVSKRTSSSNNGPKKTKKAAPLMKAPLVDKGSFNRDRVVTNTMNNHVNTTQAAPAATQRMFQYPQTTALSASSLFQNSSHSNLLNGVNNNLTLISPRGVSLIRMKGGAQTLLSPTAATILSPRANKNLMGPPPVIVPNTTGFDPMKPTNVGNGFSMTTPIANLTPVHIPYLGATNNVQNGGHSPLGNGFQSPINYNINTPQSPLGNYSGITPIINAFTPTASGVSAITPTTNLPFYWSNIHNGVNNTKLTNTNNTMGHINMDNDPLAPTNMNSSMNFFSNQSNNPYVQKQLQNSSLLRPPQLQHTQQNNVATSPMDKPPASTFFKYPIPNEEPKSSPSNSQNVLNGAMLMNGANNLIQNQSLASYGTMDNNDGMDQNNGDDDHEERQMDEPPSLDEINNMRSIPSVISPNGTTPVVMITNLNEDEIDCDKIFTLCGVFGDVQRVKISYHKRDTAFVQLSNHRQAKHVVTSLNRMQLYGKMIHVNLSRMTRVKLPKDSPNSAMMFPDAKFLTKDYTNCKRHRYSKKGAGGIKYSPLSIGQPSHILHIANLPIQSEAKDLQEFLCGNGIFTKNSNRQSGFANSNDKIQSIELIGVNNKLGSCQAFAKCHSVDIACQILIDYHSKEFLGREIKISFATRSHMPSDINKTHKTYSYSTAKKVGASINSIPTSIPRQNSNPIQNNNSGDNMSSSSSSNGQPSHNGYNDSYSNRSYMQNGHHSGHSSRNSYNSNNSRYNSHSNQVSHFPKNVMNRNSYMSSYDNSVGYQTYDIVNNNKQPPPDQDKIFVRQHHHSGGRKYHYKLRINK
eukprot:252483_1